MSLLLDALSRASKDKAAAATATVAKVVEPTLVLPDLKPDSKPDLKPAIEWPAFGTALSATGPELALEPASTMSPIAPEFTVQPKLEPAPATVSESQSASEPEQAPVPEAKPEPALELASPAPAKLEQSPPLASPSAPSDGPRVAQTIFRAKAVGAKVAIPRRLIALGAVAMLLAAGLGSVMLGLWGDPMTWFQSAGVQAPAGQATLLARAVGPTAIPVAASVVPSAPTSAPSQTPVIQTPANTPVGTTPKASSRTATETARTERQSHRATGVPSVGKTASHPEPKTPTGKSDQPLLQSRSSAPSALELGYAALTEGHLQEAQRAYTQALEGNPQERDALLGLAYIAHQQGRAEEARGYYKQVLRQEPGNPVAQTGLLTLNTIDNLQTLGTRASEVAEQHPDSAAAQSVLGYSLARQDRLADAKLAFSRAQQLEPGVALHAFNLAVALDRLHEYAQAQVYYQLALTLSAQSGGGQISGLPIQVVQARLAQLHAATLTDPAKPR